MKLTKLELVILLVTLFFFSLNASIIYAQKGKVDDNKLNLILKELNLSGYNIETKKETIFSTPSELKEALNQPINPEKSNLTYGGYVLSALYEKNLIKSIISGEYIKIANRLWDAILDINVPAQVAQIGSKDLLVGTIEEGEGSGLGVSILLKIPELLEIGVAIKTLKEELSGNQLKFYFQERFEGSLPEQITYTCRDIFSCPDLSSDKRTYYESLWKNWGNYYSPNGLIGNIDLDTHERLRNVLAHAVKELKEKQRIKEFQPVVPKKSLLQKIKDIPQNISEGISNFFEEKKQQIEQAIEKQIEKVKRGAERRVNELAIKTQKRIEKEIEKQVERQVEEMEKACAIKSTVIGTPLENEIEVLRNFRDEVLLKNKLGEEFVKFYYYHFSPPIVQFLSDKPILKEGVRQVVVEPIIYTARTTQGVWNND